MNQGDIKTIKEITEEFFGKMTITVRAIDADFETAEGVITDVVSVKIRLEEPQMLIGEKGQTLFEVQRVLRLFLNKKMQKLFYLNLDINEYKQKKIEYLKDMAKELADEVALNKEEKILNPMPAYERRIIHAELANRPDVTTESQGIGSERCIIIKPK